MQNIFLECVLYLTARFTENNIWIWSLTACEVWSKLESSFLFFILISKKTNISDLLQLINLYIIIYEIKFGLILDIELNIYHMIYSQAEMKIIFDIFLIHFWYRTKYISYIFTSWNENLSLPVGFLIHLNSNEKENCHSSKSIYNRVLFEFVVLGLDI